MNNSDPKNRIIKMITDYRASKILLVAAYYDLFTIIARKKTTLRQISQASGLDPRALTLLLDALVSMGFLKKESGGYKNERKYTPYLVEGKMTYIGNNLKYQEMIWDAWSELKDVLRTGKPRKALRKFFLRKSFNVEYIKGMRNIARRPAQEIATLFKPRGTSALLDVGAGPGTYALAFLERHPSLQAYLLDLPSTIKITKKLTASESQINRLHFIAGDYHTADFGRGRYDFVIMSNITHDEGGTENERLIKKAYWSLRPEGHLIIHDFMKGGSNNSSLFDSLFSVHMLVYTEKGRVYSSGEYCTWLKKAGFSNVEKRTICRGSLNSSNILIATRPRS